MAISPLAALNGLKRAQARGAPAGYENSSNWNSAEIPNMMTYRARERDRQDAKYLQDQEDHLQQSLANPSSVGMRPEHATFTAQPAWAGFNEGLNFNDTIAAAGPDAKHKVVGLLNGLPQRISR
jgi:hypothetical protein